MTTRTEATDGSAPNLEKSPLDVVLASLRTSTDQGLTRAEARQRLGTCGPNALVEKQTSLASKLLG